MKRKFIEKTKFLNIDILNDSKEEVAEKVKNFSSEWEKFYSQHEGGGVEVKQQGGIVSLVLTSYVQRSVVVRYDTKKKEINFSAHFGGHSARSSMGVRGVLEHLDIPYRTEEPVYEYDED